MSRRARAGAALLAAAVAAVLGALPAAAVSPRLSVADPKGDAIDPRPSMDITNLAFEVKKVKPADPVPSLIVTLSLAGAPEARLASYTVHADIAGCGSLEAKYLPGNLLDMAASQSPSKVFVCNGQPDDGTGNGLELFSPRTAIGKDSITWTIALDSIPKAARAKKVFTGIYAYTALAEPLTGIVDTYSALSPQVLLVAADDLHTDKRFEFA